MSKQRRQKKCVVKGAMAVSKLPAKQPKVAPQSMSADAAPRFMSGEWLKKNLDNLTFTAWDTELKSYQFGKPSLDRRKWTTVGLSCHQASYHECGIATSIEVSSDQTLLIKIYLRQPKQGWEVFKTIDIQEELLLEELAK